MRATMDDPLLQEAIAAARAGERERARKLFSQLVQRSPGHEQGWLWLSGLMDDPEKIVYCLQRVLSINPESEPAREGLAWIALRSMPAEAPQAEPRPIQTRVIEKPI